MPQANITPPTVNASIDYSTGKDVDGVPIQYGLSVEGRRANEAITRGQLVQLLAATATTPLSVEVADAAAMAYNVYGVAVESAAADSICRVATDIGWVLCTTTVAAGADLAAGTAGVVTETGADETGRCCEALSADIDDFFGTSNDAILVRFTR